MKGDPIYASEWNDIIREIRRLGNYGSDTNVIATGIGTFVRSSPRRPAGATESTRTEIIRFQIQSVDLGVATCTILSMPFGMESVSGQTGTGTGGTTVEIEDPNGCYFDETSEDLVGRKGWASYMSPQDSEGTTSEGTWEVFSLCCPP